MLSYRVPSGASMMGSSSIRAGAAAGALNWDSLMPALAGMRCALAILGTSRAAINAIRVIVRFIIGII